MSTLISLWHSVVGGVAVAHPALLFMGLVLLPLVGTPVSPLWILAGVRFGTPVGFAVALSALLLNYTIGYWLARRWLRNLLVPLLERRHWRVPRVSTADEPLIILLARVTPGLPLFFQNYLLGIAEVRFGRYLGLSVAVQFAHVLGFVWLGHSLANSMLWKALLAAGSLAAAGLLLVLLRRWLSGRTPVHLDISAKTNPS